MLAIVSLLPLDPRQLCCSLIFESMFSRLLIWALSRSLARYGLNSYPCTWVLVMLAATIPPRFSHSLLVPMLVLWPALLLFSCFSLIINTIYFLKLPTFLFFFFRTRRRAAHQYIKKKRGKDPQNVTEMMGLQLTQKPVLRDSYKKKKIVMTRNTRPEASKWLELLGRGDEILLEPRQKTIAAFLLW